MLNLPEVIYILAMHEEKGTVVRGIKRKLRFALSAATIAELALQGKINIEHNQKIKATNAEPTGDKLVDKALEEIQATDRSHKVAFWLETLPEKPKKLQKRLINNLVAKQVVRESDTRLVWEVPYNESPQQNASAKYWIKSRLRALVLTCGNADLRDLAAFSIISSSGLLPLVFTLDERKLAQRRIYEMMISEGLNNPVAQWLEEIQAAVQDLASSD